MRLNLVHWGSWDTVLSDVIHGDALPLEVVVSVSQFGHHFNVVPILGLVTMPFEFVRSEQIFFYLRYLSGRKFFLCALDRSPERFKVGIHQTLHISKSCVCEASTAFFTSDAIATCTCCETFEGSPVSAILMFTVRERG